MRKINKKGRASYFVLPNEIMDNTGTVRFLR
jgi:hypothetical protein